MHEKLKQRREELRLTQKNVAQKIGIAESAYQRYERGVREPSVSAAIKLAKALNTTVEYLYSDSE